MGAAVLRAAVTDDIVEGHGDVGPRDLSHMSKVSKQLSFVLNMTTKVH